MSEALEAIASEEDGYEEAKCRQLALMREGLDLGTCGRPVASRDELWLIRCTRALQPRGGAR